MSDTENTKATRAPSRYRKVEVRTWGDEKFRSLSALPPCGQGLWLFLITGPHTGPIPGLFRAGRAAMAEELDWELEAFDKAFQEVFQQGMVKADFKARVMWVPNAIKHNRPESPNVVKSWAAEFDLIPECDLKREALEHLRASVYALGEAFGKAFDETFGKASAKASPKAMPNQEQEQEQEQDRETREVSRSPSKAKKEDRTNTLKTFLDGCKANGVKPIPDDHPIRQYMADSGISEEMAQIAWLRFREEHTVGARKSKRYTDWPATFANSVKDRWYRLWFVKPEGEAEWTSEGLQAKRAIEAAMAAKMQQEAA